MISALLLPFVGSALCMLPARATRPVALAVATIFLGVTFSLILTVAAEPRIALVGTGPAGLGPALALDRHGAVLLALIAAVTLAAIVQSTPGGEAPILLTAGGLSGAILSSDILTMILFLQLGALATVAATGTDHPAAAQRSLAVQTATGIALVFGAGLLYSETGTLALGGLSHAFTLLPEGEAALVRLGMALILTGLSARAGLAPAHLWLPASAIHGAKGAMNALTAGVTAALVLKLLPLLEPPLLEGTVPWLAPLGLVTAICGLAGIALSRDPARQAAHAGLAVIGIALASDQPQATATLLAGLPAAAILSLAAGFGGPGRLCAVMVAGVAILTPAVMAGLAPGQNALLAGGLLGAAAAAAAGLFRARREDACDPGWPLAAMGLAALLLLLAAGAGPVLRYITVPASGTEQT